MLIAMQEGKQNFVERRMLSREFDPLETEQLFNLKDLVDQIVKSGLQTDEFVQWSAELRQKLDLSRKIILSEFAELAAADESQHSVLGNDHEHEEEKEPIRNETNTSGGFEKLVVSEGNEDSKPNWV